MANPKSGKIQSTIASQQNQLARQDVSNSPTRATAQQHIQNGTSGRGVAIDAVYDPNACAGCGEQLKEGQALIALDRQWHISCFRFVGFISLCVLCSTIVHCSDILFICFEFFFQL